MSRQDTSRRDKLTKEDRLAMAVDLARKLDGMNTTMTLRDFRKRIGSEAKAIRDHLRKHGLEHVLSSTSGW